MHVEPTPQIFVLSFLYLCLLNSSASPVESTNSKKKKKLPLPFSAPSAVVNSPKTPSSLSWVSTPRNCHFRHPAKHDKRLLKVPKYVRSFNIFLSDFFKQIRTMRGLTILPNEPGSNPPQSKTICSRIRRVFKGPQKPAPAQPKYRDEKKYHHTPSHSRSSFIKTTTTKDMIAPIQGQLAQRQTTDVQLIDLDPAVEDHQQSNH